MESASLSDMDPAGVIEIRVKTAVEMRETTGLPSEDTTVYRLINRCTLFTTPGGSREWVS